MPLAGPSSWLPAVGNSELVRDHRESLTWLRRQPLNLQLILGGAVPHSLPGRGPAPLWVELSFLKKWALLSARHCPRKSLGPRKLFTSLTPFSTSAKQGSSHSLPKAAPGVGCPSSPAQRHPVPSLRPALYLFRFQLVIMVSWGSACPSWDCQREGLWKANMKAVLSLSGGFWLGGCAPDAGRRGVCLWEKESRIFKEAWAPLDDLYQPRSISRNRISSPVADTIPAEDAGLAPGDRRLAEKVRGLGASWRSSYVSWVWGLLSLRIWIPDCCTESILSGALELRPLRSAPYRWVFVRGFAPGYSLSRPPSPPPSSREGPGCRRKETSGTVWPEDRVRRRERTSSKRGSPLPSPSWSIYDSNLT